MVKVVDAAVLLDRTERVELHLCVALSRDRDALAVLEVDNLKYIVADDDHVAGAETMLDPATEVQSLLNKGRAVRLVDFFNAEIDVFLDVLAHLFGVKRIVPETAEERFGILIAQLAKPVPQMGFCQCVGMCSFSRRLSRLIRKSLLKTRRGRAGEPPLAARRA